jgi:hypothetical protein
VVLSSPKINNQIVTLRRKQSVRPSDQSINQARSRRQENRINQYDLFAVTDNDMVEPTPLLYKNYDSSIGDQRGNNETRNRHPVPSFNDTVVLIDIISHESIDVTSDSSSKSRSKSESSLFRQTQAPEA